ncbi:nuclear transport factor 2 family protein [Metapseudomonas lalkuanensis]|uniref:Nuclear transport factor 2 family protein n=1 Tax=Metapseudomonas lalkuanensis TaxID=2604832 RepID=A0A5J6QD92_9GAMM|nr:nuclear transport factor 2 family protein [Pseudomonas lalkuanensis]
MTGDETDRDAIRQVVRDYVDGMLFADENRLRSAFHPDCRISPTPPALRRTTAAGGHARRHWPPAGATARRAGRSPAGAAG